MSRKGAFESRLTVLNGITCCLLVCSAGLLTSDAVGPVHASLLAATALYQRWRWSGHGGDPRARRSLWEAAAFATLIFFVADLFIVTRNLIGAALRLLAFIVVYHADNPQSPRGARQTLGLTFIQMIAAAASTTEVSFSILMAIYLASALYTLAALGAAETEEQAGRLAPHAPDPRLRIPLLRLIGAATPVIIALGLGLFFLLPHYGTGYFHEQGRSLRRNLSGFSDRIELGSIGSIKKSHATVMRVRSGGVAGKSSAPPLPLRMRGIALDGYDGRAWSVTDTHKRWLRPDDAGGYPLSTDLLPPRPSDPGGLAQSLRDRGPRDWLSLDILLEPLETRVLFTPPDTVSLTPPRYFQVGVDRQGTAFAGGSPSRRFTYQTISALGPPSRASTPGEEPPEGSATYLQLPAMDHRVETVAEDLTRGSTGAEAQARAIERRLREEYAYSLDVNDSEVESPLVHFLVERKPGHCEYFATAMAVLLRLRGIPSRVVNGFYGGERSELTGQTLLRQSDAHSWVEAWIPGQGWTTFDPTPADAVPAAGWGLFARFRRLLEETEIAWDTYIVGLDLEDQRNMLEDLRDRVELGLAEIVIVVRQAVRRLSLLSGSPGEGTIAVIALGLVAGTFAALLAGLRLALRLLKARRRTGGAHAATEIFRRFEKACGRAGLRRQPHVTASAFARRAGAPSVGEAFEAARFGPPSARGEAIERLRRAVAAERNRSRDQERPLPARSRGSGASR